jgi:hypothetical protein
MKVGNRKGRRQGEATFQLKEILSKVMNDVLESEGKFQDFRISAKRRVPSTGYTLGSAIQTHEFLFHRACSLQTSGACEV